MSVNVNIIIMESYLHVYHSKPLSYNIMIIAVLLAMTLVGGGGGSKSVVEMVERRSSRDTYVCTNATASTCHEDNKLTYLVDEDKCVNNEELMKGI